jgi:hypothetical protein
VTFISCDTNDDDFYNSEYISIPNLVQIETQGSYSVGDYIYVSSYVNRLQAELSQTNLLDLRKSTGNADAFKFSYLLEKKINGTDWLLVDASPANRILVSGQFDTGSFYDASAIFNPVSDRYEFKTGIKLLSTGEYRISFGYNSSSTNQVELTSNSTNGNISITIFSDITNLDGSGYYNFSVN